MQAEGQKVVPRSQFPRQREGHEHIGRLGLAIRLPPVIRLAVLSSLTIDLGVVGSTYSEVVVVEPKWAEPVAITADHDDTRRSGS